MNTGEQQSIGLGVFTDNAFKPFLVGSCLDGGNIFRIIKLEDGVTRSQIEMLLENLPIFFRISKEISSLGNNVNEPLDVVVSRNIIWIYPPKHRVIACTTLDAWQSEKIVSKMHVDNVMDTTHPGNGQIRTCVHFEPKILGVNNWFDHDYHLNEVEIDINVFPKGTESGRKIKVLTFGKHHLRNLLNLIAGGQDKKLTLEQLNNWRDLIMYAVDHMRSCYENPDVDKDYPVRVYYMDCWTMIEHAGTNEEMVKALEYLRTSIDLE